jgi:hypothetical protein
MVTLAGRADVVVHGLAACAVIVGVVQVAVARRAGAARPDAAAVADPDVVGEWAAGEPGVRVRGQPVA